MTQQELEQMMKSPQAAKILQNKDSLMALANSPDAQKFMQLLKQKSGSELEAAANAAMKGDPAKLAALVNDLSKNPEGARVVQNLTKNLN